MGFCWFVCLLMPGFFRCVGFFVLAITIDHKGLAQRNRKSMIHVRHIILVTLGGREI